MKNIFEVLSIEEIKSVINNDIYLKNTDKSINYLGVGYIKSLAQWVDDNYKSYNIKFICDCDDDPSLVYAAIKLNFKYIIFKGDHKTYLKLQEISQKKGVEVSFMNFTHIE